MAQDKQSIFQRLLARACDIQANETKASLFSFLLVFILMAAYYLLRPVRDAMASDWTDAELSWLWTFTFLFSAVAVSIYGAAITRLKFQRLVPGIYGLFACSFILFYFGSQYLQQQPVIDKCFYVWVSVFSLFHISVFWSFMADTFSKPQATRLFGFIGAGASAGAIAGPGAAAIMVSNTSTDTLLLIASVLILLTLPVVHILQNLKKSQLGNMGLTAGERDFDYIGGKPFSGFTLFLKDPFLLAIGLFIFLYTAISSFVYFELKNLLADYDRETRAQIWASMDLAVNCISVVVATFATGRIAKHLGLAVTLASVPVLIAGGLLMVAAAPMASVVIALQIVRRAGNYAISRPASAATFKFATDRHSINKVQSSLAKTSVAKFSALSHHCARVVP